MHETDGAITSSHAGKRSDVGGVEEGAETADIGRKSPPSTETDEMEAEGGGEDEEAPVVTADQQPVSEGERVLEDTAYVWGMWWCVGTRVVVHLLPVLCHHDMCVVFPTMESMSSRRAREHGSTCSAL